MGAPALAYTQRRADTSPLWALVSDWGEAGQRAWEERFEGKYGPWRPHWRRVLDGFLECGDLACGFARVRCPDCGNEYLLPHSCKRRLCPTCEAKRRVEWADHVVEEVLPDLGYRQLVFTVPQLLRRTFLRERRLLGELVRTAYGVTRLFLSAQFPGVAGGVPYFVGAVETWGSVVNCHPHAHALCSEGVLDREGQYHALPAGFDWGPLAEMWRQAMLAKLVEQERLSETTREVLLSWHHSGFSADASTGAAQGDREGLYRLVCYLHKPVLSLGRMEYTSGASRVIYHGKNEAVGGRGTVVYEPLEFMALLLAHVAEPHEIRLRYYGAASSTIRRGGRKGRLSATPADAQRTIGEVPEGPAAPAEEESGYVKARRRTWAQLLARVYGVDALKCGRCGGRMRIISFISDPDVIERILRHRGEWGPERKRGPPGEGEAPVGRAAPEPCARRVVVDEYAQEFAREDGGCDAGTAAADRCEWDVGA